MKPLYTHTKILMILMLPIMLYAEMFSLKLSSNKIYVGESILATLSLKYENKQEILNTDLEELSSKHFWVKELNSSTKTIDNFTFVEQTYIISAQVSGMLNIEKQQISIAQREDKTNMIIWKKLFSEEVIVEVVALPKETTILGEYIIQATVDKTQVDANTPINLTLSIEGDGNLDDIEEFELKLQDELVFTSKAVVTTKMKKNLYGGRYTQQFSIIGEKNFVIPEFSFTYFDTLNKQIKTIKTKPFNIEVKEKVPKTDLYEKYMYGVVGFVIGIFIFYILSRKKISKREELPILIKIKKAKNDKELYDVLLPYAPKPELTAIMKDLENNIYNKTKNRVDKKEILKLFFKKIISTD